MYHPETDGQTKHMNQILEQYLHMYINYQQDNWFDLLPLAEFTYNNTEHTVTHVTPFFANKGYHPSLEVHVKQIPLSEAYTMTKDLDGLHSHLKEQLHITIQSYELSTDEDRLPIPDFEVGDYVWLDVCNICTK